MSKSIQKPIVHLRVYRGNGQNSQLSYNANGTIQNENNLVKLKYNTIGWVNYLKHLPMSGFVKVSAEKVFVNGAEVKDISLYEKEVEKAFTGGREKPLTPEQKQIAQLQERINALEGEKSGAGKKELSEEEKELLAQARKRYEELYGKKGFAGWSLEEIQARIVEAEANATAASTDAEAKAKTNE